MEERHLAYVQSAYRKPPKQKAAISIKNTNCEIMARNDNTIKLFLNVTKANLKDKSFVQQSSEHPHEHDTYRGKSRHAMSARLSMPTALAQAPSNQNGHQTLCDVLIIYGTNSDGLRHIYGELRMCKIRVL